MLAHSMWFMMETNLSSHIEEDLLITPSKLLLLPELRGRREEEGVTNNRLLL